MVRVVLDTHIFLRSLGDNAPYRWLKDTIVEICDTIVVNKPIVREYARIAEREGFSAGFITMLIQGQQPDVLPRSKLTQTSTRSKKRLLGNIPAQDQPFVEAARASRASYLITEDRKLQRLRTRLEGEHIEILHPDEYLAKQGPNRP